MQINEKNTSDLDEILRQAGPAGLDAYLKENTLNDRESAADYLSAYIALTEQKKKEVIARAGLSEQYGYQLLNGSKTTTDRDKIIGLCIAAGLDIRHTDRVLKLSGFSPLYSKIDRDAVIMTCINRTMNNVIDVNEELDRRGMALLNFD